MPSHSTQDVLFMLRALYLAQKGLGRVSPNPMVGCVVVQGGKVVGEGYHRAFGKPHAEVTALHMAGKQAQGSTLFVNLEPCSHWGKTPPCVEEILAAGVRKVVAAIKDPNPRVSGKGFRTLRAAGVQVKVGLLEEEARTLNRAFLHWVTNRVPYVTLKLAVSLDWQTVPARGRWMTTPEARRRGHELRAQVDAILVGIETVLKDDPLLTSHGQGKNPLRVVLDSRLRIPLAAKVLNNRAKVLIVTTDQASRERLRRLEQKGISILQTPSNGQGQVSLTYLLRELARRNVAHLLVEGGAEVATSFLNQGLVNEVKLFVAPRCEGRRPSGTMTPIWPRSHTHIETVGQDTLVSGAL